MATKIFNAVRSELGKPRITGKKARMKVHEMRITRGQQGGYVAHHTNKSRRDGSPGPDTGPYPIADDNALLAHIRQHLATGADAEPDGDEEAAAGADSNPDMQQAPPPAA